MDLGTRTQNSECTLSRERPMWLDEGIYLELDRDPLCKLSNVCFFSKPSWALWVGGLRHQGSAWQLEDKDAPRLTHPCPLSTPVQKNKHTETTMVSNADQFK